MIRHQSLILTYLTHSPDTKIVPCEFDLIYADLIQGSYKFPDFETFSVHRPLVSDVRKQYPLNTIPGTSYSDV